MLALAPKPLPNPVPAVVVVVPLPNTLPPVVVAVPPKAGFAPKVLLLAVDPKARKSTSVYQPGIRTISIFEIRRRVRTCAQPT